MDKENNLRHSSDWDESFMNGRINGSNFQHSFQSFSYLYVFWDKSFAVSTPRGIELYQPDTACNFAEIIFIEKLYFWVPSIKISGCWWDETEDQREQNDFC